MAPQTNALPTDALRLPNESFSTKLTLSYQQCDNVRFLIILLYKVKEVKELLMASSRLTNWGVRWMVLLLGALFMFLGGCQPIRPLTPAPAAVEAQPEPTVGAATAATAHASTGHVPVEIAIPAIGLSASVASMGWEVTQVDGETTTQWVVPTDAVGWEVNSAEPGAAGRVVLAGRQATENAPFAPLARGEVEPGQEIWLTDGDGGVYIYTVVEVSAPIALIGATTEEEAAAAAYVAPTDKALLTLVTGWPDYTTTHRIFVVAEYTRMAQ